MAVPLVAATRRNHAIEHATIAVLIERRGRPANVIGQSDPWGFVVRGPFTADEVADAANEAIRRLGAGESHLAVTPLCGTNLVTAAVLAGGAALLATGSSRRENWSRALTASLIAMLGAGRAGAELQRRFTTDARIGPVAVQGVSPRGADDGRPQAVRVRLAAGR